MHFSELMLVIVFCVLDPETSFRSQLLATEQELVHLRTKVADYQAQSFKHEKAQRETARLKGIINGQQQQVH